MRCFGCCFALWTRNPNRRSTILLLALTFMIVYTLLLDASYPFDYEPPPEVPKELDSRDLSLESNISCPSCKFYPVSGVALDIGFKCVKTATKPSTTVCIYDEWSDMYISHDLQYTGRWEPNILKDFQQLLGKCHSCGVIDLGANIGFYTLIAAKMGHKVISVEPFRDSIYRIHRALYLEGLGDRVYVLENAISDERVDAVLKLSGNNQGDHRLRTNFRPCLHGHCPPAVRTIILDDLVSVIQNNFTSAILKMDIQGYEQKAFRRASILFDSIHINYIFMEWFLQTKQYVSANHTSRDKTLVEDLLTFLFGRDFRPFSLTSIGGRPLDPDRWHEWPFDVIWIRLPDAVEQRTIISNHYRNWPS